MSLIELKIMHTNDLHASIGNLGKIAAYIEKVRRGAERFLYVDGGDIFSGHPVVDWKQGKPIVDLLNLMKLDVMAIGNHDFDYGQTHFEANQQLAEFTWLAANMIVRDDECKITQPEPYKCYNLNGLKVGIVSVIETPPSTVPEYLLGLEFLDPIETLNHYLFLKKECDILIALTHVGFKKDLEIAEQVDGYDMIIGAHSHTVNEFDYVNGTAIVNAGAHGLLLGELTFSYDLEHRRLENINSVFHDVDSFEEVQEAIQTKVDAFFRETEAVLQKVVGRTNTGLPLENFFHKDVALGNFWTDALRFVTDADIALTNNGGIRYPIPPGYITAEHIFRTAPFKNQLVILEMTGEAIVESVRLSYERANKIDLQTSGLSYVVWKDESGNLEELELYINGDILDPNKVYRVVTNDYIAFSEGYAFKGKLIQSNLGEMSKAMLLYAEFLMEKHGVIDYQSEERILIKTRNHAEL